MKIDTISIKREIKEDFLTTIPEQVEAYEALGIDLSDTNKLGKNLLVYWSMFPPTLEQIAGIAAIAGTNDSLEKWFKQRAMMSMEIQNESR